LDRKAANLTLVKSMKQFDVSSAGYSKEILSILLASMEVRLRQLGKLPCDEFRKLRMTLDVMLASEFLRWLSQPVLHCWEI